ncbi:hypothetical protein ACF0H5_006395 [Mactra antiquata]
MTSNWILNFSLVLIGLFFHGDGIFVDPSIPYKDGPLMTGELTVTVTIDRSPKHVKVYFPLQEGEYAVVYFLGGLATLVPAEFYSIFLTKLASHGFYVFGVDYDWPIEIRHQDGSSTKYGQDIDVYFQEIDFLQKYMKNRTLAIPDWNITGLMCHSAGCDVTLKMIEMNKMSFKSSVFLEPYSQLVRKPVQYTIPALMYGTQLAFESLFKCNIHGYGFQQFYKQWKCPRVALEVADFGHCDILDPIGWEACHVSHFCKTTNNTRLGEYRQFVQGVSASFFISTLQGRSNAINYIVDQSKLTLKCLVDVADIHC